MTRREILADTIARLEAERFQAPRRPETTSPPLPPITSDEAARNAALLLDAISDDPTVVAYAERETA